MTNKYSASIITMVKDVMEDNFDQLTGPELTTEIKNQVELLVKTIPNQTFSEIDKDFIVKKVRINLRKTMEDGVFWLIILLSNFGTMIERLKLKIFIGMTIENIYTEKVGQKEQMEL